MPDLKCELKACSVCGHVQGLTDPGEKCCACGGSEWIPVQGEPRAKALMPKGGAL